MGGGKVWLQESSLTDEKGADADVGEKRKAKKAKIPKRTTPTVVVPNSQTTYSGRNDGENGKNYATIERSSYKKNSPVLDHEDTRSGLQVTAQPCRKAEFCGWETDGGTIRNALESSSGFKRRVAERSSLNTPADGYRSTLQSRACSRVGGRRRKDCYEFKHLSDIRAYLEDYSTQCSYSGLSLPPEVTVAIREVEIEMKRKTQGVEGRERASSRRRGVQRGNQYLEDLATRLGVGVLDKKQLYHRSQPTPPSFTRKTRVAVDLLVTTQEERRAKKICYYKLLCN